MELATTLSRSVPAEIRERGKDCFQSGVVSLDYVKNTSAGATVEGTELHEVDLDLDGDEIMASCTCPYAAGNGLVCKHIWATVLAAQKKGFASSTKRPLRLVLVDQEPHDWDEDEWEDDDYPRRYDPPKPKSTKAAKPGKSNWKDQLAALGHELQPGSAESGNRPVLPEADKQLLYVIDLAASERNRKLFLDILCQERKKNNEWGKPKGYTLSQTSARGFPDPNDQQLLSLLLGAERDSGYSGYYGYYNYSDRQLRLSGPLLDTVLPVLAATGRLRLRDDGQYDAPLEELTADLDPAWRLTVEVAHDKAGKNWVLSGRLKRDDEVMDLSAPRLLIPGVVVWEGRLSRFDDGGAFGWVPGLRKQGPIAVPVKNASEFLAQLLQMRRLPQLELPEELRFTEEKATPRPKLKVKAPTRQAGAPMITAELSFDYAGNTAMPADPSRGVFLNEEKRYLLRDREAESRAAQRLTQLGLRITWTSAGQMLQLKAAQLPKLVRELMAEGWQVEAEGKLYRQAGGFQLDVKTCQDWFDLNARIDFEGTSVSLPRLLAAVNRGDTSIVLDDGSLGMVPEDWLKKYGLIARMGQVEGEQIRFSRSQVGVLDALLASRPEVTFDEQFARARDRLKEFEGVAPVDPPFEFQGTLREYQREGLGWLQFLRTFGFGGCLADDMGLGKTVQVLALLAGLGKGPVLVVVPRSLIFNWKQEAARFVPSLNVLDHTGQFRDRTGASFKDYDLILTTYGTLRNDAPAFTGFRFDTCVLDESQAAKNAETETAKAVRLVNAEHRLSLSGTPVENHLGELWTLFDFLNPGMLGRGVFVGGSLRNPDPETRDLLAKALRPFILRRTKDQVAKDLPEKTEQTVYCDLEGEQRELYDELREHYRRSLLSKVDAVGLKKSKFQILEALLRLRQAACHPGLIDRRRTNHPSAKLDLLLPQITETIESGHKVLVFSQFTSLLAILKSRLDEEKTAYEYLDGRTRDRASRVERFQTDPECRLFLISLKAGGVGLNLTAAEYVFLLDPWWNPAVEAQAIDRSHRIGQTKPVFAYRLIARNTVEEKVLALQQQKRELADAILGGDGRLITDLKREDLELLLS